MSHPGSAHGPHPDDPVTSAAAGPECCGEPMLVLPLGGVLRFSCVGCGARVEAARGPTDDPPTSHPCGSGEKVLVMRRRAELRLPLFHPLDSRARAKAPSGQVGGGADAHVRRSTRELPPGVKRNKARRCYEARANLPGGGRERRVYLGLFDDPATAGRAVEMALAGDVAGAKRLAGRSREPEARASKGPIKVKHLPQSSEDGVSNR